MLSRTSVVCRRMSDGPFVEFGYDGTNNLSKRWHGKVVEDHQLWRTFGSPPFNLRALPAPMFQGHLAILEGESIKREERQKEIEKQQ